MGKLSQDQIQERLKSPSPSLREELEEIAKHDEQIRFHAEPTKKKADMPYLKKYLDWVADLIDPDKHAVFEHLLTFPIETVDFSESLTKELRKALNGQNKNISFNTTTKEVSADYADFLKRMKDEEFWPNEGLAAMRSGINSIMIVDLPARQSTKNPEPYYYLMSPDRLKDAEVNRDGSFEWIIFADEFDQYKFYAFDEDFYMSFFWRDGRIEEFFSAGHGLGFCPARTFWSEPYNSKSRLQRLSPFTNSVGSLDWLLFMQTSTKHTSLYAGFPIYIMYEERCSYVHTNGNACVDGKYIVEVRDGHTDTYVTKFEQCPRCATRKSLGAGSVKIAPARASTDDPDYINGVNIKSADTETLKWLQDEIERLEQSLTFKVIGIGKEVNEAAKNELQVNSGFESRINVILWVKENFEKVHKFVLETMGKLRHGAAFMGATVNYGTKFFLYDYANLLLEFQESKKAGLPNFELAAQIDQILETKYQNNPDQIARFKVLKELEPFRYYTLGEIKNFPGNTDPRLIQLKKSFEQYVARFEEQFTNVVNFLPFAEFEQKINFIRTMLMSYVDEDLKRIEETVPDEASDGNRFGNN